MSPSLADRTPPAYSTMAAPQCSHNPTAASFVLRWIRTSDNQKEEDRKQGPDKNKNNDKADDGSRRNPDVIGKRDSGDSGKNQDND